MGETEVGGKRGLVGRTVQGGGIWVYGTGRSPVIWAGARCFVSLIIDLKSKS